jgi:hypothetical protein
MLARYPKFKLVVPQNSLKYPTQKTLRGGRFPAVQQDRPQQLPAHYSADLMNRQNVRMI